MLHFKICLFLFAVVRYYQNSSTPVTGFVKIWKFCFHNGSETFLKRTKCWFVTNYIGNMIVTLTTIMDSHECPEYRTVRYCARISQVSCKKNNEILLFSSSGAGSVTQPIGVNRIWASIYRCQFRSYVNRIWKHAIWAWIWKRLVHSQQGLKTRNRVHPRSLPRSRSHQICPFAWITKNAVPGSYLAVIFSIMDDDYKLNVLSIPQGRPGWHSVITRAVHHWQNVPPPPYVTEPAPYTGQVLSNDAPTQNWL